MCDKVFLDKKVRIKESRSVLKSEVSGLWNLKLVCVFCFEIDNKRREKNMCRVIQ